VQVLSPTQLTAISPAGTGIVDVRVTAPGGTSVISAGDKFSYLPTVTKVSPSSGPAAGGTTVTITGTNFATPATVTFGGVAATGVQVLSPTQLTAISPAGTGKVDVRVTAPGGTSAISPADKFSYT